MREIVLQPGASIEIDGVVVRAASQVAPTLMTELAEHICALRGELYQSRRDRMRIRSEAEPI